MNKKVINTFITLNALLLFLCVNHLPIHKKNSVISSVKIIPSFNQLPITPYPLTNFIAQLEEEDDDTKNKFKIDLIYSHISRNFKFSANNYHLNNFQLKTLYTNLYTGIPIYTAIGNYRI